MGREKLQADEVRKLYDQHGPALVAYACSFVWDTAVAEDTVHQVFLRLLSDGIARPESPVAYVYRAVRNAALNQRRSIRKNAPPEEVTLFGDRREDREAALALQTALGELPQDQREVVIMRIWSGMTLEEVAATNAALRYWLAFADIQDPPADKATAELLEKTAAGEAAWDEAKLGPILDKNKTAIWRMQRATKLPECDWGLEYDLGPRASVAYVPKARVLERLNTLYGLRMAAKGETQKAVDSWLAGIRFSQHLAQGGSLIFTLVGKMAMTSNFRALTRAAQSGMLNDSQKKQIETAVSALPETGFDWAKAFWYEQDPMDIATKQLAEAKNPAEYYAEITGEPVPANFSVPKPPDVAAYHRLTAGVEAALRLPPSEGEGELQRLQESVKTLHPFYQKLMPSFQRINNARSELQTARAQLLKALASR